MAKEYTLIEKRLRALARSPRRRAGGDGGSSTSADGSGGSGGSTPGSDDEVAWSRKAGYAEQAGQATEAEHALTADTATEAGHAVSADTATEADHAASADTATEADHALTANTATRLATEKRMLWGRTYWMNGIPYSVSGDMAVGNINMSGTVKLGTGTGWRVGSDGAGRLNELGLESGLDVGTFRTGLGGTGGTFRMIDGKSYLETDRLYVRMKAYFDSLEIRRYLHSGGNRVASAAGCKCRRVEWLDSHGEVTSQLSGVETFRCYFLATDGDDSVTNDFTVGDQAYCHTTNLANDGLTQRHYWRLVTGKGQSRDLKEHYIDLSNMVGDVSVAADGETYTHKGCSSQGDSAPAEGDDIVQLGHGWDGGRQGAIIESVSGQGQAPTYRIYQDIDSFTLPEAKIDMGYDTTTGRAYINIGDANQYLRFNYGNAAGLQIKAVIDAQSPVGGKTLATYISSLNALQTALEGYAYLKAALEGSTQVLGGLILTQLIGMKNSEGDITAGLNGDNRNGRDIAAWFGGNPYAQDPVVPKIAFRFDGSGYLAGGNISWVENGDTEVKGTVRAENLYHKVCYFREGGTYVGDCLYYYEYSSGHDSEVYGGFVDGQYYTLEEILDISGGQLANENPTGFVRTVGAADVVMCMPTIRDWQDTTAVKLPAPGDFEGKTIEVYGFAYGVSETPPTIVVGSAVTNGMALLAYIDGDGKILFDGAYNTIEVSTGGCAKFQSVKGPGENNYRWVLLANQTGGDVYGGGGQPMSVGLTMPVGFEVANSPVTNNGTLAVSFATGYSLPTTAKQQEWDAKQAAISDLATIRARAIHGQTAYSWGNHAKQGYATEDWVRGVLEGNYLTESDALNLFALGTHDHDGRYLKIDTNGAVIGNLLLGNGTAVKASDKGADLLAYKDGSKPWGGVTGEHWFVGASGVNGYIRSAGALKRWVDDGTQLTIWDSGNLDPSAYLRQTDIAAWALASSKPTYTLDEVADGVARKLSDYLRSSEVSLVVGTGANAQKIGLTKKGSTSYITVPFATEAEYLSTYNYGDDYSLADGWSGTMAFCGMNLLSPGDGYDYAGLQVGYSADKWQLTALAGHLYIRQNDNPASSSNWTAWRKIIDSENVSTYLSDYTTQLWVDTRLSGFLPLTGGTMETGAVITLQETVNNRPVQSPAASQRWVKAQGFLTEHQSLAEYATQLWVSTNYQGKIHFLNSNNEELEFSYLTLPLSYGGAGRASLDLSAYATRSAWKVKDVEVIENNARVFNGEFLMYDAELGSDGVLKLYKTPLEIYIPDNLSEFTNDAGFITSSALNSYWAKADFLGVKVKNVQYTPVASGTGRGWIDLTDEFAALISRSGDTMTGRLQFKNYGGSSCGSIGGSTMTYNGTSLNCLQIGGIVNFDGDGAMPFVNGNPLATQEWVGQQLNTALTGYLPLSGGMLTGSLMMGSANHTTNDDSAKIAFCTNVNYQNISPYIQAIYEKNYGRKRLSVFQKNEADWDTPQVEVFTILPNGNVGIGTTSPSEKLHVAGNIKATGNVLLPSSGSLSIEGIGAVHSNNGALTIGGISVAVESEGSFTYNGSQVATVSSLSGYLHLAGGAMTGNISYKGTGGTNEMIRFIDSGLNEGNGIAIGGGGATIIGGGESAVQMAAQVQGQNEVMYIGNDQNVSIFTYLQGGWGNRKEFLFTTSGDLTMSNAGYLYWRNASGTAENVLGLNTSNQLLLGFGTARAGYTTFIDGGTLRFRTLASGASYCSDRMTILANGNVGIGTTSPETQLHVNGSAKINGVLTGVTNIDGLLIFDQTNARVTAGNFRVSSSFALESGCSFDMPALSEITFDTDSGVGIDLDDILYLRGNNGINLQDDTTIDGTLTVGDGGCFSFSSGYVTISGPNATSLRAVDVKGSVMATSFVNGSDVRMKDISAYLDPSVHDIAAAPVIEFAWKGNGGRNLGTIAQYWAKVFPQAVHEADGMLTMEYGTIALAAAVTAARKAEDNERRIAELEMQVAELKAMVAATE